MYYQDSDSPVALQHIKKAEALNSEANSLFCQGNFPGALSKYCLVFPYINGLIGPSSSYYQRSPDDTISNKSEAKVKDLQLRVAMNQAAAYLKIGKFERAVERCDYVLNRERRVKAYYRRAVAFIELGQTEKALKDLKLLLGKEPRNTEAFGLIRKVFRDNR